MLSQYYKYVRVLEIAKWLSFLIEIKTQKWNPSIPAKDPLIIGLLLNDSMLCKPKRHCIKVETIRDVHGYVMDGVNCDTVSYLV